LPPRFSTATLGRNRGHRHLRRQQPWPRRSQLVHRQTPPVMRHLPWDATLPQPNCQRPKSPTVFRRYRTSRPRYGDLRRPLGQL